MYFVPHFGHAKVYETSIWTPCFQLSAKTLPRSRSSNSIVGYAVVYILRLIGHTWKCPGPVFWAQWKSFALAFLYRGMAYQSQNVNNGIPEDRVARSIPGGSGQLLLHTIRCAPCRVLFHGLDYRVLTGNMPTLLRKMRVDGLKTFNYSL